MLELLKWPDDCDDMVVGTGGSLGRKNSKSSLWLRSLFLAALFKLLSEPRKLLLAELFELFMLFALALLLLLE
jgi:hypothetical protein